MVGERYLNCEGGLFWKYFKKIFGNRPSQKGEWSLRNTPSIMPKNGSEQQKLKINWDDIMFSNELTLYLKIPGRMRWLMNDEKNGMPRNKYVHKIYCWEHF